MGLVFLITPALYAILSPLAGYLADTFQHQLPLLLVGLIGYTFGFVLLGPVPFLPLPKDTLWLTLVALTITGLFMAFFIMPSFAIISRDCVKAGLPNDLDLFGLISGTFLVVINFGAFVGPLLGGVLVQNLGFAWASSIVALLPAVNLIPLAIYVVMSRNSSKTTDE